ncbi:MAG: hypothetical protein GY950_30060, partial [bacterium]|nr:hypothetical protein [bacterium]
FAFYLFFLVCAGVYAVDGQEEIIPTLEMNKKEQYRKAMEELKLFRAAILDYLVDFENAPEAKNLEELVEMDIGNGLSFAVFYMEDVPEEKIRLRDTWGNEYVYKYEKEKFWIASSGSDGKFDGFEQKGPYKDTEKELKGKDIIISNDGFIYFPMEERLFRFFRRSLKVFGF